MRRHVASYLMLACIIGVLSQDSFDPYANNNNNNNYDRDRQNNNNYNSNDPYNRDRNQSQYDRDRYGNSNDNYNRDRNRDYDRDRDRDRYGNDPYNRNQSQYGNRNNDNYSRDRDNYDRDNHDRDNRYGDNTRSRDYDRDRDRDRYGQDNNSRGRDQYGDDRNYGGGRLDDGNCCEEYCYSIDDEPYIKFGDKTAYQFIYGKGTNQHIVPQCKPVQFWTMIRDGTKLPDRMTIQRLRSLNRIHDDIVRNYEERRSYPTKGRLCQEDYELFKRWRWNDTISDHNENGLTAQGADDLKFFARRLQTKLRDLLSTSYSETAYYFQYTSDGERTVDSYRAFVEGLLTADAFRVHANVKPSGDRNNPFSQCNTYQYQSSGQYGGGQGQGQYDSGSNYGSNYGGSSGSNYGSSGSNYGTGGSNYGSGSSTSNYGGSGSNYGSSGSNYGSGGSNSNYGTGGSSGSTYGTGGSNYGTGGSGSNNYGSGSGSNYGTGGSNYGSSGSNYGTGGSNYGSSGSNYDNNNYNTNNYGSGGQGGYGGGFGSDGGQGFIEYRKFTEKQDYREMVRNVFRRLGFRYSLNESVVMDMYDMCRYEKAWNVNRQSPWCSVFTKEQLKLLEYGEDLKTFYDDGYGSFMNKKKGCIPLKDLHDKFERTVNGLSYPGNAGDQKASFQFTDAATLRLLLTAMGIAEDHSTLTADNYFQQRSRQWRTADLTPFGGNFAAILYQCDQGEKYRVMLFLNEKPVEYPGCSVGLCSWNTFKSKIEYSVRECNYCGSGNLPSPGTLIYLITSILLFLSASSI